MNISAARPGDRACRGSWCPASGAYQLASGLAGRTLGVERALQQQRRRGLVHRLPPGPGVQAALLQRRVRQHRREALVDQPHRHRSEPLGQRRANARPSAADLPSAPPRPTARPTTISIASLSAASRASSRHVACTAPDSVQRRGEQAARIAPGDPDPDRADVDAEPDAWPHISALRTATCAARSGSATSGIRVQSARGDSRRSHPGHELVEARTHPTAPAAHYVVNKYTNCAKGPRDRFVGPITERSTAALRHVVLAAAAAAERAGRRQHQRRRRAGRARGPRR